MSALEFRAVDIRPDIELLRGLNRQEVDLILAAARARRFSVKSVMTYQGEPADHLLLLWKGRARYFFETPDGKKLILIWITPGHAFGGAALGAEALGARRKERQETSGGGGSTEAGGTAASVVGGWRSVRTAAQ